MSEKEPAMRVMAIATLLLVANSVCAQDSDDDMEGLTQGHLIGDPSPVTPTAARPQLVQHDRTTVPAIGTTLAVLGGVGLVTSWAIYVARQNYRLRYWTELSYQTVGEWETQGAFSLWFGVGSSAAIVASEYLLLPELEHVPLLAWIAGGVGLGVAAVGLGFAIGGTHCGPELIKPGATLRLACTAGTSDALFGPILILTALPLMNLPLAYLLKHAFGDGTSDDFSLNVSPRGLAVSGRF